MASNRLISHSQIARFAIQIPYRALNSELLSKVICTRIQKVDWQKLKYHEEVRCLRFCY